ncbi:MAG: hypothetical protein QOE33_578 [Acidobacteriota bacterium]|nr:hypothetical protein [Acidobacteriota bacterium]
MIKLAALCVAIFALAYSHASAQKNQNAKQTTRESAQKIDAGKLFAKNCATCHGNDGRAKTFKAKFNHARDLTDPAWQSEASDERIVNSITNGRERMPKFGQKLSREEIGSLAAYVRGLKK